MNNYNVIIIGAGPAGAYLAFKLKNQGISVLLLEKEIFPRYKSCAGGLSKKAYDILYSENKNIEKIVEKKIRKILYIRNKKFICRESEEDLIYMTYRSELDSFLVNMAVDNKNIYFFDNVSIKKINQKEKTLIYKTKSKEYLINFDILVGAWGNKLSLNNQIDINPFERFSMSSSWEGPMGDRFRKYFDEFSMCQIINNYPGFVGYIFPKSKKITAGVFTSIYLAPFSIKKMWIEFIEFWGLDKKIKPHYALIPIRDFSKPIAKDNILLVGDAAGLADPFTGEGIYYSLISSEIASKNIIKYFNTKDYNLAQNYNQDINSELSDIQKWAKIYEYFFHLFPNISFWFGSECIIGNKIVNTLVTGEIKYNEVLKIIKFGVKNFFKK